MQRSPTYTTILFTFIISSPIIVLAQFNSSKISNNIATKSADSVYFESIKNTSKAKQIEIPAIKFDENNKNIALDLADSKYSEWLKKSSKAKQIEMPAVKFDENNKVSAVVIADSKYFEYIRVAEIENNKPKEQTSPKLDVKNQVKKSTPKKK